MRCDVTHSRCEAARVATQPHTLPVRMSAAASGQVRRDLLYWNLETYLCHDSVGASALLVLEDDVRIVVGDKVLKPGVVPRDGALR
ncbi:hypothetical protein E2C01_050423 [Portunus trituberculatus]|uniref:Uncharacterized protein n=1 Tax=Portunus trituberculatus TaxID=210409 RepID=A0A5B7GGG6_PORTR|nr:hypothetical protein [Portunus trituberculatus]